MLSPMVTPAAPHLPIIVDCDPGHDDAIAMVVAARHANLLGVTTVSGNAPLTATTRNALVMRDLLEIDVPVHSGAARPLVAEAVHAAFAHGESGLDGADLPEPTRGADSDDAIGFIIETCRATEGVWLVGIGPLTNLALALRAAPDLAGRIAGISVMGGGTFGNSTAAAEFNIWVDPEAAAAVFGYGGPLVHAGLQLTHQLQATPARIDAIRARPGRMAALLADLLVFFAGSYVARHDHLEGAPIHDAAAVLALTHPHLFERKAHHVVVETAGIHTRGMTLIDQRGINPRPAPNADVLWTVDVDGAFAVITDAI